MKRKSVAPSFGVGSYIIVASVISGTRGRNHRGWVTQPLRACRVEPLLRRAHIFSESAINF